jgi:hypothetical protein
LASSLFLSGWRLISSIGFNRVEMCTGPVVPRGGNLTAGSGSTVLFLLVTGMGILMGAGGALVANAWFMSLYFLIVNIRALAARELQGPDGRCLR